MSTQILPSLVGLGFNVVRSPKWSSIVQRSASGKETAMAMWSYPQWNYELTYELLRSGSPAEFQALAGFFNARLGRFDSFLYEDPDDCSITGQALGGGDGSNKKFQLARSFGGFIEPMFAPKLVSAVYLNGVPASGWTVSNWGTAAPGVITFATAPSSGVIVSATFTYYFPCRFADDQIDFNKFLSQMWNAQSVKFYTLK